MERDIEEEPGFCPKCGSDQVNFGDVEFQSDISYQDCGCNDCGCRWMSWRLLYHGKYET